MKTLVYHLSTPSYRQVEFGQAVRVDDRMPYVPDLNVKIVRTQEIYETAAQEDGSHQERALERHRVICRRIEVSVAAKFWNTCTLKSTRPGADAGHVFAIQALSVENNLLYDQVEGAEHSVKRLHTLADALKHQAELIAAENAKLDFLKRSLQHFDNSTS